MNKIAVPLVVLVFLFSSAFAGVVNNINPAGSADVSENEIMKEMNFSFNGITVNGGEYENIASDGCSSIHRSGYPVMPYKSEVLTFPLGTKIDGIDVSTGDINTMHLDRKIIPASEPVRADMSNTVAERKEGKIYLSDEPYPSNWVEWNTGAGLENGKHVVFLSIHAFPARYTPAANELRYVNEINVKVRYTPPSEPLLTNDIYDLVIIAPSEFSDALQPLVTHKENHGIKTVLVTLDEIYNGNYFAVQGRDDAEKVKYFIKDALENWGIKYVMLVGGRHGGVGAEKWWCPVRYSNLDDGSDEEQFLTDLYFSDIYRYENGNATFDDWDSNGDGVFAEWRMMKKDNLDLYPDVYVGRLACRNSYEVKKMVEKIITYETTTYGQSWFKDMVVVGGDSAPIEGDPYCEGEEENKVAIAHMDGFEATKIWTSTGTLTGSDDVINAVNKGCGFLFFDGHGNPMSWATHPPYDENTWIDGLKVQDMNKLSNDGKYPVCIVGGCHNSQFNVSLLNLLKIYKGYDEWYRYIYRGEVSPETWSWWLARMANKGSIATLGYAGLDWFATGDGDDDGIPDCTQYFSGFLNTRFFMEYGDNGLRVLGELHGQTLTDYLNVHFPSTEPLDYKTVEEWVLLGDPSLMVGGYQ